jgi:WD40 repeat protein
MYKKKQGLYELPIPAMVNLPASVFKGLNVDIVPRVTMHFFCGWQISYVGSSLSHCFSPNGNYLAIQFGGYVYIYEAPDWGCKYVFNFHPGHVWDLIFSPDSRYLAAGIIEASINRCTKRVVQLLDIESGNCNHSLQLYQDDYTNLFLAPKSLFSPDSKYIATLLGGEKKVCLWNTATGNCMHVFEHQAPIRKITFRSKSKNLVTFDYDGIIGLWSVEEGYLTRPLKRLSEGRFDFINGRTTNASFSPCGQFLSYVEAHGLSLCLINVDTRNCIRLLDGHHSLITHVAFSPDGQFLASGDKRGETRLWRFITGECIHVFKGYADITSISFSPNGKILAVNAIPGLNSSIHYLRIWDIDKGHLIHNGQTGGSLSSFSPCGRYLATSGGSGLVCLLSPTTGKSFHEFKRSIRGLSSIRFSQSAGHFATVNCQGMKTVQLWNIATGEPGHTLKNSDLVISHCFSPCGRYFATGCWDYTARLFDVTTGGLIQQFIGCEVDFDSKGELLATADHCAVHLWSLKTGSKRGSIDTIRSVLSNPALSFSACGSFLAIGCNGIWEKIVKIYHVATGSCIKVIEKFEGEVKLIKFSPSGRYLAIAVRFGKKLGLWHAFTGRCIRTFEGHQREIMSFVFSRCGKYLITAGEDNTIRIFEVDTGQCTRVFEGHSDGVSDVVLGPKNTLISVSYDGTCRFWDISTGETIATLYNLDEGFLWATPPDANEPCGRIFTNREDLISVCEANPDGSRRRLIGFNDPERISYLARINDQQALMERLNDPEAAESKMQLENRAENVLRVKRNREFRHRLTFDTDSFKDVGDRPDTEK